MTKRFWLSFTDSDKPKGEQFLGVCIVEVTEDDAADALAVIKTRPSWRHAQPGAEWLGAALRVAHQMGCNPGGAVGSLDITDEPHFTLAPVNRLLSRRDLFALGLIDTTDALYISEDPEA